MNRLTKLLSLLALFSFSIATENTEEAIVEKSVNVEESTSNDVSSDQDIAPVDIENIMRVRQAKAEKKKMNALRMLNKHKNPTPASDPNMESYATKLKVENSIKQNQRNGFLKNFAESLRKKFPTKRLQSTDGKRAIKLPTNTESK
tara:strand:+ start:60 stop:497 length:438 start_codon:yes stop_codon:yes gene_type:complete